MSVSVCVSAIAVEEEEKYLKNSRQRSKRQQEENIPFSYISNKIVVIFYFELIQKLFDCVQKVDFKKDKPLEQTPKIPHRYFKQKKRRKICVIPRFRFILSLFYFPLQK